LKSSICVEESVDIGMKSKLSVSSEEVDRIKRRYIDKYKVLVEDVSNGYKKKQKKDKKKKKLKELLELFEESESEEGGFDA